MNWHRGLSRLALAILVLLATCGTFYLGDVCLVGHRGPWCDYGSLLGIYLEFTELRIYVLIVMAMSAAASLAAFVWALFGFKARP